MIKTVFLVPVRDNAARPFSKATWRSLDRRLMAAFGGFTVISQVRGAWESQGRIYHDVSRQYIVVLNSWNQFSVWLDIVGWARETFHQEAMYVEVNGHPEIWRPEGG
jgi:hypothetical protein